MKLVSDGFLLKAGRPSQKDLYVQLIDYSELGRVSGAEARRSA